MPTNIDALQIEINAKASKANDAIDRLVGKLDRLSVSLGRMNTTNLNGLSSGVQRLGNAMQTMNSIRASDFTRLAKNLEKMGNINVSAINSASVSMSHLARGFNNLGTASKSMQNGLNRTSTSADRARKSFGGLASIIGKFYASYFLVIRGIKGLWNSINSTADYVEAFNYFDVALGKVGKDWSHQFEQYGYENAKSYAESFSKRLSESLKGLSGVSIELDAEGNGLLTETGLKNLGLNIQEVTQYASQLASVTNSVGQTGEVSLATASAFSKLGADMSSLFNVDYSSVMNNLQSGLIGQSRALYKYGIDITNATLQTYAYELGLSKAVSEMTQAEKMQLRMIAILDQSKVSWGDLANTINSPSNMIRQFKNNLKETGIVLGQLFTPLLQRVMPVINGLTIAIKRLLVSIAQLFGIELSLEDFGRGYTEVEDSIEGLTDDYEDLTDAAKEYKNQAMKFDEINPIKEPDTSSSDTSGASGGIDLTSEILDATGEYEKAWQEAYDNMQTKAEKFADGISKALKPISTIFEDIAKGDWLKLGKDTSDLVSGIFKFFSDAIKKVKWKQIGKNIGLFLAGINWLNILKSALTLTGDITKAMADVWFGSLETAPLETAIATILGAKIAAKTFKISTPLTLSVIGATLSIGFAKGKLDPIFDEYDLNEIKKASEEMFTDWFGKNYISITLSDMFVLTSTAIVKPQEIIDALSLMWNDIVNGDFKLNWFNVMEFPSWNEFVKGLKKLWGDVKANYKFGIMGIMEFPVYTDIVKKLRKIWSDVKSGDFRWKLWGIIEMPSFNQITSGLKKLWTNIKNGDYKWGLWGLFSLPTWLEMKTGIKKMWTNIKSGDFKFAFIELFKFPTVTELTNRFKSVWNGFAKWINNKLKIEVPAIEIAGKKITSKTTVNLGSVPTFATGGFPEDGWFRASKGEYFGQFDDGTSYISNNEQIENGIAKAVAPAIYNAVVSAMSMNSASGDTNVYIDGKQVFKAVRTQAKNYELQTGKPAFS